LSSLFCFLEAHVLNFFHFSSRYSLYLLRRTPPQQDAAAVGARDCVLGFIINLSKKVPQERVCVGARGFTMLYHIIITKCTGFFTTHTFDTRNNVFFHITQFKALKIAKATNWSPLLLKLFFILY
jgi:hypothetical protein